MAVRSLFAASLPFPETAAAPLRKRRASLLSISATFVGRFVSLVGLVSSASGDEVEGEPGSPAPDEDSQCELEGRVAVEGEPGPEHGRQEQETEETPRAEDVGEADGGAGDARGV